MNEGEAQSNLGQTHHIFLCACVRACEHTMFMRRRDWWVNPSTSDSGITLFTLALPSAGAVAGGVITAIISQVWNCGDSLHENNLYLENGDE